MSEHRAQDRQIDDEKKRLLGRKVWFKPRSFGYGWTPASWEGWTVTLVWMVVSGVGVLWLLRHHPLLIVPWVVAWCVVLLVVILATD
jgi:hypothetical protein